MPPTPFIAKKIIELEEHVRGKTLIHLLITWAEGGQLRVLARKDRLFEDILRLKQHHESFHGRPYNIRSVVKLEELNKNRWIRLGKQRLSRPQE